MWEKDDSFKSGNPSGRWSTKSGYKDTRPGDW